MVGSGIRDKPIPDPGSGEQKGTGSRDPDPQHCYFVDKNIILTNQVYLERTLN
jgi:hypothetical protein